jgi:hypothetical protein
MSFWTILFAATTAVPGSQASSPMTSSTLRPRTPPASFASLTASFAAAAMAVPEGALRPDIGRRAPSRTGSEETRWVSVARLQPLSAKTVTISAASAVVAPSLRTPMDSTLPATTLMSGNRPEFPPT